MGSRAVKLKKLRVPYCPGSNDGDDDTVPYEIVTLDYKIIRDYTGLSFNEIDDLLITDALRFLRDAVIYNASRTDSGKEYLRNCYLFEQEKPDYARLDEHSMK